MIKITVRLQSTCGKTILTYKTNTKKYIIRKILYSLSVSSPPTQIHIGFPISSSGETVWCNHIFTFIHIARLNAPSLNVIYPHIKLHSDLLN